MEHLGSLLGIATFSLLGGHQFSVSVLSFFFSMLNNLSIIVAISNTDFFFALISHHFLQFSVLTVNIIIQCYTERFECTQWKCDLPIVSIQHFQDVLLVVFLTVLVIV